MRRDYFGIASKVASAQGTDSIRVSAGDALAFGEDGSAVAASDAGSSGHGEEQGMNSTPPNDPHPMPNRHSTPASCLTLSLTALECNIER